MGATSMGTMWLLLLGLLSGSVSAHGPREHPKSQFAIQNLKVAWDPQVSIIADATEFKQQRQKVSVQWAGINDPSLFVALYVPANANPWRTLPVQFANASEVDPSYLQTGSGKASFTLLNMRGSFKFVLIKGGVVHPHVIAQTAPIKNKIAYQPTGGHLALHADQRSVVVQWVSGSHFSQNLQWAETPQSGDVTHWRWTASSTFTTYHASDMCGYPANASGWIFPGFIHTATIPASTMKPGNRYTYRYGAEGRGAGWSSTASFIAPLGPGVSALRRWPTATQQPAGTKQTNQGLARPFAWDAGNRQHQEQQQGVKQQLGHVAGLKHQQQGQGQGSRQTQQEQAQVQQGQPLDLTAQQWDDIARAQVEEEPFVFLVFNDVAQTYPLLFNNPWQGGLHFAADYGENSTHITQHLVERAAERGAHLALMIGDLAYAMGYGADWDMFGDQFEAAFRQWPMAVGTGNHEADWPGRDAFAGTARDSGGECNVPFMHRWYTPANIKGDPQTSYYQFKQGPVHFLVLDSEAPSDPDSPQGKFVASALASVDRQQTPWLVVTLHRMMVAPATWRHKWVGDVENMERLQSDYEELFRQYKVDVVIQGHEHAYARTCPMYKGACIDTGNFYSTSDSKNEQDVGHTQQQQQQQQQQQATAHSEPTRRRYISSAQQWLSTLWSRLRALMFGTKRQCMQHAQQGQQQTETGMSASVSAERVASRRSGSEKEPRHTFRSPAGGPVYMLAGHAGAGFTYGFPKELPSWVEYGAQGVNGLLRFTTTSRTLLMEAVAVNDGSVMDHMLLVREE